MADVAPAEQVEAVARPPRRLELGQARRVEVLAPRVPHRRARQRRDRRGQGRRHHQRPPRQPPRLTRHPPEPHRRGPVRLPDHLPVDRAHDPLDLGAGELELPLRVPPHRHRHHHLAERQPALLQVDQGLADPLHLGRRPHVLERLGRPRRVLHVGLHRVAPLEVVAPRVLDDRPRHRLLHRTPLQDHRQVRVERVQLVEAVRHRQRRHRHQRVELRAPLARPADPSAP